MRPRSRADFAIAIICALPLEADAVEVLFEETYDRLGKFYGKQPGDANAYINGRIGNHDVVLCYMPRMGKGSAASVASSLRVSYTGVQLALVVGICGGVPSYPSASSNDTEIFLGDVIISDAVVEYDFGRQYPSGFQRKTDGHKDMLGGPDREIRTLLTGLKAIQARNNFQDEMLQQLYRFQKSDARWRRPDGLNDLLFEASYHHKHYSKDSSAMCRCFDGDSLDDICEEALENSCDSLGCDSNRVNRRRDGPNTTKISVHIGKVASADTVMKSGEHRDQIVRKERVIGFEMEGAGVWDNIPCIIIKGVCDYADSHKNKNWQDYAAATAACGLKVFLGYYKIGQQFTLIMLIIDELNLDREKHPPPR
jgi:nucleoside phosphorylase